MGHMSFDNRRIHTKLENTFSSGDNSSFVKNKWSEETLRDDLDGCFIVIELQQHVLFVKILNKKV